MRALLLLCLIPGGALAQDWTRVEPADRPITVDASGIVVSENALRFGPPPSQNWRITIMEIAREGSRVEAGDIRFGVTMDTDQLTRNVQETEATFVWE